MGLVGLVGLVDLVGLVGVDLGVDLGLVFLFTCCCCLGFGSPLTTRCL